MFCVSSSPARRAFADLDPFVYADPLSDFWPSTC